MQIITEHIEGTNYVVLPKNKADKWHGFYYENPVAKYADFKYDNKIFSAQTDFAPTTPKTHYDVLCSELQSSHAVLKLDDINVLAINGGYPEGHDTYLLGAYSHDDVLYLIAFHGYELNLNLAPIVNFLKDNNGYQNPIRWDIDDNTLKVVSGSAHGAQNNPEEYIELPVTPGSYNIENKLSTDLNCSVYRFKKC